jgi:anti-sigma B factor antagonist
MLKHSRVDLGTNTILHLRGSLNALTAPGIRGVIDALVEERRLRVTLDLGNLELIDSSGVGAIVSLFKRLRMLGGDVTIARLRGQPREIFRILGLERVFSVVETVEDEAEIRLAS